MTLVSQEYFLDMVPKTRWDELDFFSFPRY